MYSHMFYPIKFAVKWNYQKICKFTDKSLSGIFVFNLIYVLRAELVKKIVKPQSSYVLAT